MDQGLYIAVFHLPRSQQIQVGQLGQVHFRKGVYFYVGSGQRNLSARLERHGQKDKPLRWHIDCLSVRAKMLGAIIMAGSRKRECELARKLAGRYDLAVPDFGASDCRCQGHLFYVPVGIW